MSLVAFCHSVPVRLEYLLCTSGSLRYACTTSGILEMVAASIPLLMASRGAIFEAMGAMLSFQAGTTTLSLRAGLETTKRRLLGSLPASIVLSKVAPPHEWPSGATSPPATPSTYRTNAAASSVH